MAAGQTSSATHVTRSVLGSALRDYVEARAAALLTARRLLGINELDVRALLYILDNPGARPGALKDYLGITSAGVTVLTDRLAQRGVLSRQTDPDDRRVVRLSADLDLASEPWSILVAFDTRIEAEIADLSPDAADRMAAVISSLAAKDSRPR